MITGTITRIKYNNTASSYIICTIITDNTENITISGNTSAISETKIGWNVSCEGEYEVHSKYGKQFKFKSITVTAPNNKLSIMRYLTNIPKIGIVTATRIYEKYGDNIFTQLISAPDKVEADFGKIGLTLIEHYKTNTLWNDRWTDLNRFDLPPIVIDAIMKITAIDYRDNPYLLVIYGIKLKYIDVIIKELNWSDLSSRLYAHLYTELIRMRCFGHTYIKYDFDVSPNIALLEQFTIHWDSNNLRLMLKYLYEAEVNISKTLLNKTLNNSTDIEPHIDYGELAPEQICAVENAINSQVSIITGGPGTGKSHIIKYIINNLRVIIPDLDFTLCAFTGKAVQNIKKHAPEFIQHTSTIHRICYGSAKIGSDLVIIDEASMVDVKLFSDLLKMTKSTTRIIMIGDVNQLCSIGPGQLLYDTIKSERFPVTYLTKNFRSCDNVPLIASEIIAKRIPDTNLFTYISSESPVEETHSLYEIEYSNTMQILTSLKISSQIINHKIMGRDEFCVGDRVMQTVNNYDLEVFNGEIGYIKSIDDKSATIEYDSRIVDYDAKALCEFIHAYSITIHKSQGSEYDHVIIPIVDTKIANRNAIYTAITRAKKNITIIGDIDVLRTIIERSQPIRDTNLYDLLCENK